MLTARYKIGVVVVGLVFLCGCTASPWSATRPESQPSIPPPAASASEPPLPPMPGGSSAPAASPTSAQLEQLLVALEELGPLDDTTRRKLFDDLKQADPGLWDLVLHHYRSSIAYQQRAEREELAAADGASFSALAARQSSANILPENSQQSVLPVSMRSEAAEGGSHAETVATLLHGRDRKAETPADIAQGKAPAAQPQDAKIAGQRPASADRPSGEATSGVPADTLGADISKDQRASVIWRANLAAAIQELETQVAQSPQSADQLARHAQLRMLYLVAGRRDDALRAIPSTCPSKADFWSKELFGLATLLDTQANPRPEQRAAEAKQHLVEAAASLGESAPLVVRNVTFCYEILSYGSVKPFEQPEFIPNQRVLLYAELENFKSQPTAKGFHTALKSSYQIFDSRGQQVERREFRSDESYCASPRRDFFIGYDFRLPERIYPGKYTLKLTVEDLKCQKVAQSSIDFTIK